MYIVIYTKYISKKNRSSCVYLHVFQKVGQVCRLHKKKKQRFFYYLNQTKKLFTEESTILRTHVG